MGYLREEGEGREEVADLSKESGSLLSEVDRRPDVKQALTVE